MTVKDLIRKVALPFYTSAYAIAWRINEDDSEFPFSNRAPFHVISPTLQEWYADPFPFQHEGKRYIFAEIMRQANYGRGILGVYCLEEPEKGFRPILEEPFHLSYPNVFAWDGEFYMLPETCRAHQLRLYKAKAFPMEWELQGILADGVNYADTSLYFEKGAVYAETWDLDTESEKFFSLDMRTLELRELPSQEEQFVNRRPGGNFIPFRDGCYHALQNCDKVYGAYLHIARVTSFDGAGLKEEEVGTYCVKQIVTDSRKRFLRNHTYNRCGSLEVIDLQYHQINLFNHYVYDP